MTETMGMKTDTGCRIVSSRSTIYVLLRERSLVERTVAHRCFSHGSVVHATVHERMNSINKKSELIGS
ncbi:hypothetical protein C8Q74DRAFT_291634 [Fomes fomentarius]|nr:hypothetical protein C8Q74DRAFT_291634 [Fomes fomentarius]